MEVHFTSVGFWTHKAGVSGTLDGICCSPPMSILRCLPLLLSREGFSLSHPSSTVKPNLRTNEFDRYPHLRRHTERNQGRVIAPRFTPMCPNVIVVRFLAPPLGPLSISISLVDRWRELSQPHVSKSLSSALFPSPSTRAWSRFELVS